MTAEEKAKFKIDCRLSGKDYGTEYLKILKDNRLSWDELFNL